MVSLRRVDVVGLILNAPFVATGEKLVTAAVLELAGRAELM